MVRIRLRRVGARGQPSYRIVIADSRSPRDGKYIEVIGFYNPRTEPATMEIKEERALHWLSVGAQPSDPVRRILQKLGTLERFGRLCRGEPMEALVAEAAAVEREPVSPRTRRDLIAQPKPEPAAALIDEGEASAGPAPVTADEGQGSAEPAAVAVDEGEAGAEPAAVAVDEGEAGAEPAAVAVDEGEAGAEPAAVAVDEGEAGAEPEAVAADEGEADAEPAAVAADEGEADAEPDVEAE